MLAGSAWVRTAMRCCWAALLTLVPVALAAPPQGLAAGAQIANARQAASGQPGPRPAEYLGAHSMLYLNTPFSAKAAIFRQAAELGVSEIRLDIELSAVFPQPGQHRDHDGGDDSSLFQAVPHPLGLDPLSERGADSSSRPRAHWAGINQYMLLSRRYHLRVLADLTSTPAYLAECPSKTPQSQSYRCPPRDPGQWARDAAEIAAHTRGVIDDFEIINEPDGRWAFLGSPQQYAAVLSASYDGIHAVNPGAQVVFGGLRNVGTAGMRWMDAVLATRGADAVRKFDVANIHVRTAPSRAGAVVCNWSGYLAARGFNGPLWVTETGYPANPAEQRDAGYQNGASSQARWYQAVIPAMLAAGASKVFVTERDSGEGVFATEGVLDTPDPLPPSPQIVRRPSFYAVQRMAAAWWGPANSYWAGGAASQGSGSGGCG